MDPTAGDRPLSVGGNDLILFDGDCAFCNGWANWIRARDKRHLLRFAPLNSDAGLVARTTSGVPNGIDSVVLVRDGKSYYKSDAAWRILRRLPGYGLLGGMLACVPRFLRDAGYDLVARNRHRLGVKDECELPPE